MTGIILTAYNGKILGPIAKVLGWILNSLYNFLAIFGIENVGLSIILFTFIVNGLMIPLQIKQQKFTKMSSKMNPELQAIQAKYKNKRDEESLRKQQMETQAVYTKYGVSPASGCLPLLITFPIFFALYRVIYNIPAYVAPVKEIYKPLAESIKGISGSGETLAGYIMGTDAAKAALEADSTHQTVSLLTKGWPDVTKALSTDSNAINYIIDVLSQFKESTWDQLVNDFPTLSTTIQKTIDGANDVNSFLGLNIVENPSINKISIIIPILAIVTQLLSTKLMMASNPQSNNDNSENPTVQSLKVMNNIMPFISGAMCLMFPIGVGLYLVANSVFRIVQTVCINAYMNHMDIDEQMNKNIEKMKNRYEKLGIDPNMAMGDVAKQKTSNINKNKNSNTSNSTKKNSSANAAKASVSGNKQKNKNEPVKKNINSKYKEGSIASYANMLNNRSNDNE